MAKILEPKNSYHQSGALYDNSSKNQSLSFLSSIELMDDCTDGSYSVLPANSISS